MAKAPKMKINRKKMKMGKNNRLTKAMASKLVKKKNAKK